MSSRRPILLPKHQRMLTVMGENIKLARKRRKLTTKQVAERANIGRNTLYLIEKGDPGVSLGAVFNVIRVFGLQDDFLKLAADDVLGRKLEDIKLLGKK
ncbi:MAG TPA: helix-turn-helix transcriptional regulator [Bacteroidales bacterium]|nr:helix-turn-helix transcriptional regulator [Bacteroidales bacterium]